MRHASRVLVLLACVTALTACGSSSDDAAKESPTTTATPTVPAGSPTAKHLADDLKATIPSIVKTFQVTADNDPNDLLGARNGYVDAAVISDDTVALSPPGSSRCSNFGVRCGAMVEVWPDNAAAQARADFQHQQFINTDGTQGNSYNFVHDNLLLRVWNDVDTSTRTQYEALWKALN